MRAANIVYWRDRTAQVIVGKGRKGAKRQLAERFEQAIDRAAMKSGLAGTDDYLSEWRKVQTATIDGDAIAIADAEAERLEAEYDHELVKTLIANNGRA